MLLVEVQLPRELPDVRRAMWPLQAGRASLSSQWQPPRASSALFACLHRCHPTCRLARGSAARTPSSHFVARRAHFERQPDVLWR